MEDVIFWELGGYKKVLEDIRQGQRSCELFMKMVQERAEIEERYARSLESWRERWFQNVTNGREVGGTVEAWCICLEEATAVAQVHRACMDRLTGSKGPIVNMMGWIDEHYKRSDNNGFHLVQRLEEEFQAASEEFSNEYNRAMRAKEAYHSLSKEAQKARRFAEVEQHETKVNDTTKTRLFGRADKLTIRENYVRRIYKRRIAGCQGEVKDRYKEQMESVLEKCQAVESVRLQCLRNQILTFISLLDMTSSSESLLTSCRSRYKKVHANDPSLDVQEWLMHFHLSRFIELPTFEEFYLEDEDYKPIGGAKPSTDRTRRPLGSFFELSLFGSSSEDESKSESSSESESSSTSSESESEMSAPTSVSSLPRSSSKHKYNIISQTASPAQQPQYQSNFLLTEDERQQSIDTNENSPHSTSSTGFPVNQDNRGSSAILIEDNQVPLQEGNAISTKRSDGYFSQPEHHIYDVSETQMSNTGGTVNNFSFEGNGGDKVDPHDSKSGGTQSRDFLPSETKVENVKEISTTRNDGHTIIYDSEQRRSKSGQDSPLTTHTDSQYSHTEATGHQSTFRNQVSSDFKRYDDVNNSQERTNNHDIHDGATEVRSFAGSYFINRNFRWASVSPPVAKKETNLPSSETCEVEIKNNELFQRKTSAESDNVTDSIDQGTFRCDSKVGITNLDHAKCPRLENGNADVCKEGECDRFQSQMSYECHTPQRHYQVTDRPTKDCLARWFLSKYPEYEKHGESMWEHLKDTNPCRYRTAMMDAKRLMLAVGARSMISSSSDKPRSVHLCNSLHRCRECIDDNGTCQCYYQGESPLFGQHTNHRTSESEDEAEDVPHLKVDQNTGHHQKIECDHVCQEAANRILYFHRKISKNSHFGGKDCGNLHDHIRESDHMCSMAAGLILGHRCDTKGERDRCRSFIGEESTSDRKSFHSQVRSEGRYQQNASSEFNAKDVQTQGSSFWKDATTSQESDFSSDESQSTPQCLSCDHIGSAHDNTSGEKLTRILKERDRVERQARETLRPSEGEFLVRVLYNFRPANWDELRLRAGEYIVQIGQDSNNGWASGRNRTKRGIFPASYVQFVKN